VPPKLISRVAACRTVAVPGAIDRSPGPESHRPRARRNLWLLLGIAVVIGSLLLVTLVPVVPGPTDSFATVLASSDGLPGIQHLNFATDCRVAGTWATEPPQKSVFEVEDARGASVFVGDGVSGSFSFTATDSPYLFSGLSNGNETLDFVNGTCSQPWRPLAWSIASLP